MKIVLIFMFTFIFNWALLYAISFTRCQEGFRYLAKPTLDTSVELEMNLTPQLMKIISTKTGTLQSIFEEAGLTELPLELKKILLVPDLKTANNIPWAKLSYQEKMDLMKEVALHIKEDFYQNRLFPGLKIVDEGTFVFTTDTYFLGKVYPAGTHKIKLSDFMMTKKVEFVSPQRNVESGLELHFRNRQSAGDASYNAQTFQEGIGVKVTHQHVHIVSPLPIENLKNNPRLEVTRLADYYRRLNFVSEMLTIVEQNGIIARKSSGNDVFFDNMSPENLKGVTQYFMDVAMGGNPIIKDKYKMAWVGFRGSDKYDQPGLMGFEFRNITPDIATDNVKLLGTVQYGLAHEEYGIPATQVESWISKYGGTKSTPDLINKAWYNQSTMTVIARAPKDVLLELGPINAVSATLDRNKGLKLLLYDWSKDPLFFNDPILCNEIKRLQLQAAFKIRQGKSAGDVLKEFLLNSGVYKKMAESIGG